MAGRHRELVPTWVDPVALVAAQVLVVGWIFVCLLIALWKEYLLPAKYFTDGQHVRLLMLEARAEPTDPFARTAAFYKLLGPLGSPGVVSTGTYLLAVGVLFACIPIGRMRDFAWTHVVMIMFALLTSAIYLAQYSKESLVLLIVLSIALSPRGRGWLVLHVAVMGVYAWWMRPYWALTAAGYLLLCLLLPRARSLWPFLAPIVGAYFALAFAANAALGVDLTSFRAGVNDFRVFSSDAQSMIVEMIPGQGPVVSAANIILDGLSLIIPWPMIVAKNPIYLVFGSFVAALWVSFFYLAQRSARRGLFAQDERLTRAVALLISVVCVQAIFEPDYGSYLKHLTPLVVLFVVVADRARAKGLPADDAQVVRSTR